MKYIGRTKVGRAKTNPSTTLAIVRLPVELKNYAGKWAHIWRVNEDAIVIMVLSKTIYTKNNNQNHG
ncbi:hypothetical protein [Archaeoglobus veneficus]|uniref:Uncharacterized protein n=1 Tax=Archaeoglobus veneficus (strain DSM 11195 / SNP6) TaxID=693661 RepID=F2KSE1_ARCVS|nr:hypothetical protein [Archaeoglobus veneficus]AEA46910.1 hypothetical protein Arcve_0897 [Archaeoglobus veneficus SNP6]